MIDSSLGSSHGIHLFLSFLGINASLRPRGRSTSSLMMCVINLAQKRYKDRVIYGYGAANPSALKYHPYNAFIWQSIQDACAEGNQSYDFGRYSDGYTGLMDFKRRWGTRELLLKYSNYPPQSQSGPNRSRTFVDFWSKILRVLPLRIYTALSERVFGELG